MVSMFFPQFFGDSWDVWAIVLPSVLIGPFVVTIGINSTFSVKIISV